MVGFPQNLGAHFFFFFGILVHPCSIFSVWILILDDCCDSCVHFLALTSKIEVGRKCLWGTEQIQSIYPRVPLPSTSHQQDFVTFLGNQVSQLLNLHLPLADWEGGQPNMYSIYTLPETKPVRT